MVRKDLLRQVRAPLGAVLILSFPVIFSGLLALSFGGGSGVPKVRLLIQDDDGGIVGSLIRSAVTSEESARYFDTRMVEGDEGIRLLEANKASALLQLPEGLTTDLLAREPVTLHLVRNPAEGILPEIAEQLTLTAAEILNGAVRVLAGPLDQVEPYLDREGPPADASVAAIAVSVNQLVQKADGYLFPLVIEIETAERGKKTTGEEGEDGEEGKDGRSPGASIFLMILPGVTVFSLFSLGDHLMRDILREGDMGTLRRQLSGPISTGDLVLGKAALTFVVTSLSLLLLAAVAGIVGRAGVSPVAFLLLSLALILAVTGSASVIYAFAKTENQGTTIASTIYLILAFSSGSFVPLESLPLTVRSIAPWSPFYWANEGYQDLLRHDAGAADIALNIGILAALGALTLALGAFLLRRRLAKGGAA